MLFLRQSIVNEKIFLSYSYSQIHNLNIYVNIINHPIPQINTVFRGNLLVFKKTTLIQNRHFYFLEKVSFYLSRKFQSSTINTYQTYTAS